MNYIKGKRIVGPYSINIESYIGLERTMYCDIYYGKTRYYFMIGGRNVAIFGDKLFKDIRNTITSILGGADITTLDMITEDMFDDMKYVLKLDEYLLVLRDDSCTGIILEQEYYTYDNKDFAASVSDLGVYCVWCYDQNYAIGKAGDEDREMMCKSILLNIKDLQDFVPPSRTIKSANRRAV